MAIEPAQLIALCFNHPDFHGESAELEGSKGKGAVWVVDALAVYQLATEAPAVPVRA